MFYLTEPRDVIIVIGILSLQFKAYPTYATITVTVTLRDAAGNPTQLVQRIFNSQGTPLNDTTVSFEQGLHLAAGPYIVNVDYQADLSQSDEVTIKTLSLLIIEKEATPSNTGGFMTLPAL